MFSQLSNSEVLNVYFIYCQGYQGIVFRKGQRSFHFFPLNRASSNFHVLYNSAKDIHLLKRFSLGKNSSTVLFNRNKIRKKLIGTAFCCVSFVDSGRIKLKSNFNQLSFAKKAKRAMPINTNYN